MDLQPTESNQLIISDGNAHSYDFSGHYAGTITLQRLHYIRLDHALTQRKLRGRLQQKSHKNVSRIQQCRRWHPYRTRYMHSWSTRASTDNKDKPVCSIQLENLVTMFNMPSGYVFPRPQNVSLTSSPGTQNWSILPLLIRTTQDMEPCLTHITTHGMGQDSLYP